MLLHASIERVLKNNSEKEKKRERQSHVKNKYNIHISMKNLFA